MCGPRPDVGVSSSSVVTDGRRGAHDAWVGERILGRYRIVMPLARGGQGVIYLARNEGAAGFVKPVVVKAIHPHLTHDADRVEGFQREARVLSMLQHPSIVSVLDFTRHDGTYAMVLDYVHGYSVGGWFKYLRATHRQVPAELSTFIVCRVLEALHYAHTKKGSDGTNLQVIHRDVAPGNILLDTEGNVRLTDFGVARLDPESTEIKAGAQKLLKGTLAYLAPELWVGEEPTPRSDVYAAAVVLHELLTGQRKATSKDLRQAFALSQSWTPERIDRQRPDVSFPMVTALHRALAVDPDERFESAAAFAAALTRRRHMRDAEVQAELARTLTEDFGSPDFLELTGESGLDQREAWWREHHAPPLRSTFPRSSDADDGAVDIEVVIPPPPSMPSDGAPQAPTRRPPRQGRTSAPPTTIPFGEDPPSGAFPPVSRAPEPRALRNPWFVLATIGLTAIVGLAAVYVYFEIQHARQAPPRFVVVEGRGVDDSPPVAEPEPSVPPVVAAPSEPEPPEPEPPLRASVAQADALTRAFRRQQRGVARCFEQHTAAIQGAPRIAVLFETGPGGRVREARISPAAVAATPLGACVLRECRAMTFPTQDSPVTFEIPLSARRARD